MMEVMHYCPRCGGISVKTKYQDGRCGVCNYSIHKFITIDPKWRISFNIWLEIINQKDKLYSKKIKELDELCSPFYEAELKKNPVFNQYLFDHRVEITEKHVKEMWNDHSEYSGAFWCQCCTSYNFHKIPFRTRWYVKHFKDPTDERWGMKYYCNTCNCYF